MTGGSDNLSADSSSHQAADEIVSTSRTIPGSVRTKIPQRKPLETDDLIESDVSSENLDLVPGREPSRNSFSGDRLLMETLDHDDEEMEKSSVEWMENTEFPDESSAEKKRLESSLEEEENGSVSEIQKRTVRVTDIDEPEGQRSDSSLLNEPDEDLRQDHGQGKSQFKGEETRGEEDNDNEAWMKFAYKGRTMRLPIPDKYRGVKISEGPLKKKLELNWV